MYSIPFATRKSMQKVMIALFPKRSSHGHKAGVKCERFECLFLEQLNEFIGSDREPFTFLDYECGYVERGGDHASSICNVMDKMISYKWQIPPSVIVRILYKLAPEYREAMRADKALEIFQSEMVNV